jgi:hypothetical protein
MNFENNKSIVEDKNNESTIEPIDKNNEPVIEPIDEDKIYRKDDGILYNIYKCAKLNWLFYLILYVSTLIIDYYTDKNWQLSLWTILYIQVWSYFLHYISHKRYIYNSLGFDLHDSHHSDNHHKLNGNTNFGPDWVDIIFKTKPDNDEIENSNSSIINSIIALIIVLITLNTPLDPVKFLMDYFVSKDIIDSPDTNLWESLYNKFFKSSVKIVVDSDINDEPNPL